MHYKKFEQFSKLHKEELINLYKRNKSLRRIQIYLNIKYNLKGKHQISSGTNLLKFYKEIFGNRGQLRRTPQSISVLSPNEKRKYISQSFSRGITNYKSISKKLNISVDMVGYYVRSMNPKKIIRESK